MAKSVRFGKLPPPKIWTKADGTTIAIKDMETNHLENAIAMIKRTGRRRGGRSALAALGAELATRTPDAGRPPEVEPEVPHDPWSGSIIVPETVEPVDERPPEDPDLDDLLDEVFMDVVYDDD
jgi:hypothetical protein